VLPTLPCSRAWIKAGAIHAGFFERSWLVKQHGLRHIGAGADDRPRRPQGRVRESLPGIGNGFRSRIRKSMAKEELIEFEGLVTEILPDTRYRVKLDTGHEIIAYTAGKMKKNRIKTLAGDRVIVEMSPYDLEKGRIIFRHKDDRAAAMMRPQVRQQFRRR
jgi:translation initiation factor IF-1